MANVKLKSSNYFGLVIRNNCKALLVREDKTSLFHFPGSSIESKKGIKDKLASLLSRKYEGRVSIKKIYEPVYSYSSSTRTSLSLVLASELAPLRFPSSFEVRFLSLNDKDLIDPLDYKGLEKIMIYNVPRKVDISADDYNELIQLKKAIGYYSSRIDKDSVKELKEFIDYSNDKDASMRAFLFLLKENGLSKEEYITYLKRKPR